MLKSDLIRIVPDALDICTDFFLDFVVALFGVLWLCGVHFVAGADELLDSEGVGQQCMLTRLAILRDSCFESSRRRIDTENGDISLRCSSDHVLDEVAMAGSVDDGAVVLRRLEFPQSDIDCDATFAFGLEFVQDLECSDAASDDRTNAHMNGLTQAYLKDLLFISAASFSNFSMTRLSMPPSL